MSGGRIAGAVIAFFFAFVLLFVAALAAITEVGPAAAEECSGETAIDCLADRNGAGFLLIAATIVGCGFVISGVLILATAPGRTPKYGPPGPPFPPARGSGPASGGLGGGR